MYGALTSAFSSWKIPYGSEDMRCDEIHSVRVIEQNLCSKKIELFRRKYICAILPES